MEQIKSELSVLPNKEYKKALKFLEEGDLDRLIDLLDYLLFKINTSINTYGKHSKYNKFNITKIEELSEMVHDKYYEYLNNLDYLNDCEKREFDENYLEYE